MNIGTLQTSSSSLLSSASASVKTAKGNASDGDSPAVEAAESPATKQAESANGGFASKSGGVNKLV